jgi:hypothetical protein
MILRELEPGDKFIHAKSRARYPIVFVVKGNCTFNRGHGSSTRECWEMPSGSPVSKSCNLKVTKVGVSIHKEKIMAQHAAPKK